MRLLVIILLINLPMVLMGQTTKSDTLTLRGVVFMGDSRRQINSIELTQNDGSLISFSTDRLGKFEVKNLNRNPYRLSIKEFNYDTAFSLESIKQKELWIFIPVACEVNEEMANLEIKQGKPRLLLIGSISPIYVVGQEKFEKRFNIKYYDFGCTPPDEECVIAYNKVIFRYLDNTYGEKWRRKVRIDVIGYK